MPVSPGALLLDKIGLRESVAWDTIICYEHRKHPLRH